MWIAIGALAIPCLYLPTLSMAFDFKDDAGLVYPRADAIWPRIWQKSVCEFEVSGPFRPVCWAHWEWAAELFGADAPARRLARWLWAALSAAAMLWLLFEFGVHPAAALLTATLAFWNPYRGEIWLGLGLTEAFAMPYAMISLVAALRAARAQHSLRWDILCFVCVLMALGIKNTFAALVPAVVWLRATGGGLNWREGFTQYRWAIAALTLTLALPVTHFLLIKLTGQERIYRTGFTLMQVKDMFRSVISAGNLDWLLVGLVLAAIACRRQEPRLVVSRDNVPPMQTNPRLSVTTGAILLLCGTGIYLPIDGVAGRYTMPAVWGVDLILATIFDGLVRAAPGLWKRAAIASVCLCLPALAIMNYGKQSKALARSNLLWQPLQFLEGHAPAHATVVWQGTADIVPRNNELPFSESVHFGWHLQARGRSDIEIRTVSMSQARTDWPKTDESTWVISSQPPPAGGDWELVREFHASFWAGWRDYGCYLWTRK
jgi:hypothetical protein